MSVKLGEPTFYGKSLESVSSAPEEQLDEMDDLMYCNCNLSLLFWLGFTEIVSTLNTLMFVVLSLQSDDPNATIAMILDHLRSLVSC